MCPPTPHHRPAFADSPASPPSSVSEEPSATSTTSVGIRLADAQGSTTNWEETLGQTQNPLEELYISSGLGILQEELESVLGKRTSGIAY